MAVTNPHPWTDDDGSGTVGTVLNNAALQNIYNDLGPETSTITSTGVQTGVALPAGVGPLTIYCNNATLLSIKGIAAGIDGQVLTLVSMGAGQVDLYHQDSNATAANRLINFATSGVTSLAAGVGIAVYVYDATTARWRLAVHEQGSWITPTYASGNFTGNGAMTWTVDAGDVTSLGYWLRGRTLTVQWQLVTTSVGGTLNNALLINNGAWGSFTSTARQILACAVVNDSGAGSVAGNVQTANVNQTSIGIFKMTGNWSAATNTTNVFGEITFEVQ